VGDENETMRATSGSRIVVIASDESRDRLGQFRGECGTVGWRTKTNFSVDRERRELLALFLRTAEQLAHLAHDACGQRDEVTRRESIGAPRGIVGDVSQCGRRYDIGSRGGNHAALDDSSPSSLIDGSDEPVRLERPEVVVHLLARETNAVREGRRRAGLGQFRQETSADRVERHDGDGGIVDDFEVGEWLHRGRFDH